MPTVPAQPGAVSRERESPAQIYKLTRKQNITGESFAMAAQVLLDKWAARGCDPKVLAAIRKDVFNIDEPKK
ncbi:MAG: hypothetical protein NTX53_06980 [candidate division WOR-3 bacterium]|nr:hypothetical protein [candidate division WOR-3 bacterium]